MSDADIDVNSLVGGASALYVTIDTFEWGRDALSLVGLSDAQFDRLAAQLGGAVAAEVLLLMVSKRCGDNENQWEEAAHLGIPLRLSCKRIQRLQNRYNGCIPVVSAFFNNGVFLSDSSRRRRTVDEAGSAIPHSLRSCSFEARRKIERRLFPSFGRGWLTPIPETPDAGSRISRPCCTRTL